MKKTNSISVIIPSYNSKDYILTCLLSIRNQSVKPKEIIVVDDCSQDNTIDVIQNFVANNDINLIIIRNEENLGPAKSRMVGAQEAKSEYITFCDSDDWIDNNCLEIFDDEINRFEADIIISGYKTISKKKTAERKLTVETKQVSVEDALVLNHTSLCTICVRKEIFLATNGPDIRNGEDKAIIPELIIHSKCIVISNKCTYNYLYREGSASIVANMKVVESLIESWEYIKNTFGMRYLQEMEYIGINHILCSTILYLFKCSFDTEKAKRIISGFEEDFPTWRSNKYYSKLGMYKKVFLLAVRCRAFVVIKSIAAFHTIKSR